jgi:hypothetical protein
MRDELVVLLFCSRDVQERLISYKSDWLIERLQMVADAIRADVAECDHESVAKIISPKLHLVFGNNPESIIAREIGFAVKNLSLIPIIGEKVKVADKKPVDKPKPKAKKKKVVLVRSLQIDNEICMTLISEGLADTSQVLELYEKNKLETTGLNESQVAVLMEAINGGDTNK